MEPISTKYRDSIIDMVKNSQQNTTVTEKDVFQKANPSNRHYIDKMVEELLLPGSRIDGAEHLLDLHEKSISGKSCLILMEHYSNFDIPCLYYLLEHMSEKGRETAESIVSIAGMKLNEASRVVLAFTEAFTRIVIYPSRSMKNITDPDKIAEEKRKSLAINRAAMHELVRAKNTGHLILVFPAGTRYRPWDPSSGTGLKEIDSYMKSFDYVVLVSVNGNVLRVSPTEAMSDDLVEKDVVLFTVSPVMDSRAFRETHRLQSPADMDTKQYVVNQVMERLGRMHAEAEEKREALIGNIRVD